MRGYMLIANTTQSAINYPALVGAMLLLVGGVLYVRHVLTGGSEDK